MRPFRERRYPTRESLLQAPLELAEQCIGKRHTNEILARTNWQTSKNTTPARSGFCRAYPYFRLIAYEH